MRKVILVSAISLLALSAFSQAAKRAGEMYAGFNFGMNYSRIQATIADPGSIQEMNTVNGLGYRLGLLGGLQVTKKLSVEIKPALSFNDSRLGILRSDNSKETYQQPITAEIACHVAYRLHKLLLKPNMFAALGYKQPITDRQSSAIQLARPVPSFDIGIGCERRFRRVIVAPELRYSYGISNIASISGLSSVRMNTIMFALNFKG